MAGQLGARIRKAREIAGLKREHVAVALEVSMATVTRWETGRSTPSLLTLGRIAALTEKPVEWFVADEVAV